LIWYVKTAANEQWARFDLKKIFGVDSLESATEYELKDGYASYDREIMGHHRDGHGRNGPVRRPIHKGVGNIMPPTRQWATDKTAELLSRR
jgi:hypothetical protein